MSEEIVDEKEAIQAEKEIDLSPKQKRAFVKMLAKFIRCVCPRACDYYHFYPSFVQIRFHSDHIGTNIWAIDKSAMTSDCGNMMNKKMMKKNS